VAVQRHFNGFGIRERRRMTYNRIVRTLNWIGKDAVMIRCLQAARIVVRQTPYEFKVS
jgi:hypothetical protein